MNDRIISLLSEGYDQTTVAAAVGCTDSYISQLVADEVVREKIATARLGKLEKNVEHDTELDAIEDSAIQRMRTLIPFVTKAHEAVMIFNAVNSAKRKAGDGGPAKGGNPGAPIVQLNISDAAAVHFRLSSDRQVIEVEGRSMATMNASTLNEKLRLKQEARPKITDQSTADEILQNAARGIHQGSVVSVL